MSDTNTSRKKARPRVSNGSYHFVFENEPTIIEKVKQYLESNFHEYFEFRNESESDEFGDISLNVTHEILLDEYAHVIVQYSFSYWSNRKNPICYNKKDIIAKLEADFGIKVECRKDTPIILKVKQKKSEPKPVDPEPKKVEQKPYKQPPASNIFNGLDFSNLVI